MELDLCYVASWMGMEFGGELDTCVCIAKALCYPPETITILLINFIPTQNKKLNQILIALQQLC